MHQGTRLARVLAVAAFVLPLAACPGILPGSTSLGDIATYRTHYAECFTTWGYGCEGQVVLPPQPCAGPDDAWDLELEPEDSFASMIAVTVQDAGPPEPAWDPSPWVGSGGQSPCDVPDDPPGEGTLAALAVLNHPFVSGTLAAYADAARASERPGAVGSANATCDVPTPTRSPEQAPVRISVSQIESMADALGKTPPHAWTDLRASVTGTAPDLSRPSHRLAVYLEAYFKAYFRDGKVLQLKVDLQGVALEVKRKLEAQFPYLDEEDFRRRLEQTLTNVVQPLIKPEHYVRLDEYVGRLLAFLDDPTSVLPDDMRHGYTIGEEGLGAFVTRSGLRLQFPVLQWKLDPLSDEPLEWPDVDYKKIGREMVRVLIEASMDAWLGTPAVSGDATGTKIAAPHRLPRFTEATCRGITAAEFALVDKGANYIEGTVGTAFGRLIRGGGPFSLNNEALAEMAETAVAVMARKVSEKALWCFVVNNASPSRLPVAEPAPSIMELASQSAEMLSEIPVQATP